MNEPILSVVGVLKLVEQPVGVGASVADRDRGKVYEQTMRLEDQGVEIKDVEASELIFIGLISLGNLGGVSRWRQA